DVAQAPQDRGSAVAAGRILDEWVAGAVLPVPAVGLRWPAPVLRRRVSRLRDAEPDRPRALPRRSLRILRAQCRGARGRVPLPDRRPGGDLAEDGGGDHRPPPQSSRRWTLKRSGPAEVGPGSRGSAQVVADEPSGPE